jgi:hypothetical protein
MADLHPPSLHASTPSQLKISRGGLFRVRAARYFGEAEAKKFWAIRPPKPGPNVISMAA